MGVSGQSRGREVTQHIDDNAADGMAHIVFLRCGAPVGFAEIRNLGFSDLGRREKRLLQDKHKKR
ncbi:hypothetical protein OA44_17800 [Enterobacter cloacae]|nr:hypothetical protein OA44_17800 [Enterobacter cloacae]